MSNPAVIAEITAHDDRFNGSLYALATLLIYLAAPVTYVDVVQAALCNKLGASAAIANLPASMGMAGYIVPWIAACLVPERLEQRTAVYGNGITALGMALVWITLSLPVSDTIRLAAVIGEALVAGVTFSVSQVFMFQCLCRATTPAGKARSLKLGFGVGPVAAVAGSLGAQAVLNARIPWLAYPADFGILYAFGTLCILGVTYLNYRMVVPPAEELTRPGFFLQLRAGTRLFRSHRALWLCWIGCFFWYTVTYATPNLSLFAKEAMHRNPESVSGLIMAIRFGCKSGAGFLLAWLCLRFGVRAPLAACAVLGIAGVLWATFVRGTPYLVAFGLLGASELGGVYFPNYAVVASPLVLGTQSQAMLQLSAPAASGAPVLYGWLTTHVGGWACFLLAAIASVCTLLLVYRLPANPIPPKTETGD